MCLSKKMSAAAAGAGAAAVNETSPAADFSVDTIKLYLQEEGFAALSRIRSKILGTGKPTQPVVCGVLVGVQAASHLSWFPLVPVQLV